MLEICDTCPNRVEATPPVTLRLGGAYVLVSEDGHYTYFTNRLVNGAWTVEKGDIYDGDAQQFPELANELGKCEGPVLTEDTVPKRGLVNLLLRRNEKIVTAGICPALANLVDVHSADSVEAYFNPHAE